MIIVTVIIPCQNSDGYVYMWVSQTLIFNVSLVQQCQNCNFGSVVINNQILIKVLHLHTVIFRKRQQGVGIVLESTLSCK